jgi:isopropylmalate/homocitrate/citramalate synthase
MNIPDEIRIVEVGPRDGLQNESKTVPTAVKIELIDRLSATGLKAIEATAFVSPKWVPQMADNAEVMAGIHRGSGISYPVLVPNMKGLEGALGSGCDEIAVFAAASESFSGKNINCSIDQSLERFAALIETARQKGARVRGYISCVLGCPYEGNVPPESVAQVAGRLFELGCYEISLGDTIGSGTAGTTQTMIDAVMDKVPVRNLAGHFHDTYGQALANILTAMQRGVAVFDSSVAGLGGCPYARGAAGNVATEDVLYMLNGLGIRTGVDLSAIVEIAQFISDALGRQPISRVARAMLAKGPARDA